MSFSSLGTSRIRRCLPALAFLSALAYGAGPEPAPIPTHPLVTAAERLYQRSLPQACDELIKTASMASGVTDDDFIRLHFLTALRSLDDGDDLSARRAISRALQIDPSAEPPPFASKLSGLIEEARKQLSRTRVEDRNSRQMAALKAAAEREPASKMLIRVADALYGILQFEGAALVLELARASTAPERAEVAVRQGILRFEVMDDEGAKAAFHEAVKEDPGAALPSYAPPKTQRLFDEIKKAAPPPAVAPTAPVAALSPARTPESPPADDIKPRPGDAMKSPPAEGGRQWWLYVGGAGVASVVAGTVAGMVAFSSYKAQERASLDGDAVEYVRNRDTAKLAINVADGLLAVGAVGVGVGAYLFFRQPGQPSAGAGEGRAQATLVIGGRF